MGRQSFCFGRIASSTKLSPNLLDCLGDVNGRSPRFHAETLPQLGSYPRWDHHPANTSCVNTALRGKIPLATTFSRVVAGSATKNVNTSPR